MYVPEGGTLPRSRSRFRGRPACLRDFAPRSAPGLRGRPGLGDGPDAPRRMRQRGRSDPVRRRGLLVLSRPERRGRASRRRSSARASPPGSGWPPAFRDSRESAPSIWQRWPWRRSPEGSGSAWPRRSRSPDTTTSSSSLRTRSGSRLRATRSSPPRCFSCAQSSSRRSSSDCAPRSGTPRARCRRSRSTSKRPIARPRAGGGCRARASCPDGIRPDRPLREGSRGNRRDSRRSLRGGARGERRSQRARRRCGNRSSGGRSRRERVLVSQETPEGQVLIANKPLLFERGEATQLALPAYLADRDVVRDLVVPIRGAVKPWEFWRRTRRGRTRSRLPTSASCEVWRTSSGQRF